MRITSCLRRLTFGMVVSGITLVSGRAASIPITNASFESPLLSPGAWTATDIPTTVWYGNGPNGVWYPDAGYFTGSLPYGNQILIVGYNEGSLVTQSLSATLQADTTYTLSYYLGNRFAGAIDQGNPISLGEYSVSLWANGFLLASDSGGGPLSLGTSPSPIVRRGTSTGAAQAHTNAGPLPAPVAATSPKIIVELCGALVID